MLAVLYVRPKLPLFRNSPHDIYSFCICKLDICQSTHRYLNNQQRNGVTLNILKRKKWWFSLNLIRINRPKHFWKLHLVCAIFNRCWLSISNNEQCVFFSSKFVHYSSFVTAWLCTKIHAYPNLSVVNF